MYDFIKVFVANALMPLPVFIGLLLFALILLAFNYKKLGLFLSSFAVIGMLVLSTGPVSDWLIGHYEKQYQPHAKLQGVDYKAIVVLGAGWSYNQNHPASVRLKSNSAMRLIEGLRLAKMYPAAKLVVSGASREAGVQPVALGYKQAAMDMGLDENRIVTLTTPVDTGREARAFKQWLSSKTVGGVKFNLTQVDITDFLLVTSSSHMPRAIKHFEAVGLSPTAAPTTFTSDEACRDHWVYWLPNSNNLRKVERAWYEFLANQATRFEH